MQPPSVSDQPGLPPPQPSAIGTLERFTAIETRIRQLEEYASGATQATRVLRELFEYTILRPTELVRLNGDPYFMFTKDLAYSLFAEESPQEFVRNATLAESDHAPPIPFDWTVRDFLDGRGPRLPRNEQWFKLIIAAHLWEHDVPFTLFDIGANFGYSSIPCAKFAQRFGRRQRIYAFEPGIIADLLRANILLNRVQDLVIADGRAVSDRPGPVKMTSMLGYSVCDSISDFAKIYPKMIPAATRIAERVTVDDFVAEQGITEGVFLKIDAEGHDWQVLQGARQTFERGQVAAAIVEFVPRYLQDFVDPADLLSGLADRHHLVSILEMRKGHHWKGEALPDSIAGLRSFARSVAKSPLTYTDIVAIPRAMPAARELVARLTTNLSSP
jgi:FkbM family methyltransferase